MVNSVSLAMIWTVEIQAVFVPFVYLIVKSIVLNGTESLNDVVAFLTGLFTQATAIDWSIFWAIAFVAYVIQLLVNLGVGLYVSETLKN